MSLPHTPVKDTTIHNTDIVVRKDTDTFCMTYAFGEDEAVFPKAAQWLPERFLPGGSNESFGVTMSVNPQAGDAAPFSMGGRRYGDETAEQRGVCRGVEET